MKICLNQKTNQENASTVAQCMAQDATKKQNPTRKTVKNKANPPNGGFIEKNICIFNYPALRYIALFGV